MVTGIRVGKVRSKFDKNSEKLCLKNNNFGKKFSNLITEFKQFPTLTVIKFSLHYYD